jgi:hypothetical protein
MNKEMDMTDPESDPFATTQWDTHRREQLQRWARIPFARKLEMLEEAHLMSLEFQRLKREKNAGLLGRSGAPNELGS